VSIVHCISVSTGKDSSATAIVAMEEHPPEALRFGACDTGNEDDGFEDYLAYMERHLGIKIARLRADLSGEVIRFPEYVRDHWPRKGVPQADCDRALKALVPTGNPFLDLCLWKGRFPLAAPQFCTDFLKTRPLTEWQMGFIDRGECDAVWSWQGVRLDESDARKTRLQGTGACVRSFDVVGGGLFNYRPILRWTAADCFEAGSIVGLKPNPLYSQGMTRVGCMPCINASKDEVLEISQALPAPHRPHRVLGADGVNGEQAAGGEFLCRSRPRCALEQARHSQLRRMGLHGARWSHHRLDPNHRGAEGLPKRLRLVRMTHRLSRRPRRVHPLPQCRLGGVVRDPAVTLQLAAVDRPRVAPLQRTRRPQGGDDQLMPAVRLAGFLDLGGWGWHGAMVEEGAR
jgi:3'-phosphoadenosine 5'-phosphosulfate sulfotransferase (PAPS reductase)/FAD synthetase